MFGATNGTEHDYNSINKGPVEVFSHRNLIKQTFPKYRSEFGGYIRSEYNYLPAITGRDIFKVDVKID